MAQYVHFEYILTAGRCGQQRLFQRNFDRLLIGRLSVQCCRESLSGSRFHPLLASNIEDEISEIPSTYYTKHILPPRLYTIKTGFLDRPA